MNPFSISSQAGIKHGSILRSLPATTHSMLRIPGDVVRSRLMNEILLGSTPKNSKTFLQTLPRILSPALRSREQRAKDLVGTTN